MIVDGEKRDLGDRRYLLSPQDLAAVEEIPELVRLGIVSFKIEGRLKTPEYVAAVTQVWHDRRKFPFRCRSASVIADSALIPSTTSTMHSLHLPCFRHDVGTSIPIASAWSNSDRPSVASIDCPLMVRVTAMPAEFLPALRFEFRLQSFRHFARRTLALRFLAPLPFRKVVIGGLQSPSGSENINLLHEFPIQRHRDVIRVILSLDLGRNFLPIKDLVCRHGYTCAASRRNKSTAAEAFAPYPSAPISSANIWLIGAPPTAILMCVKPAA